MQITFFSEDINFTLKQKTIIRAWIQDSIQNEHKESGSINYIFTSDEYLLNVNKEYLNHNYFTDIITFNYCEDNTVSGDIFISIDTVKNNSTRFGVSFLDELHRVMIHGILHLIGFDDQTDDQKAEMKQKENEYLERFRNLL